jgi:hypothetical protein
VHWPCALFRQGTVKLCSAAAVVGGFFVFESLGDSQVTKRFLCVEERRWRSQVLWRVALSRRKAVYLCSAAAVVGGSIVVRVSRRRSGIKAGSWMAPRGVALLPRLFYVFVQPL